ncbi:MAG: diguanylate cyclase, partial [Anaerolineales bacterium]|nr:diguanylate cyclase [Anaerolineales bacterium]
MAVGSGLAAWHFTHIGSAHAFEIVAAAVLAAVAQVLRVEGATAHSSYEISWVVFGFTFVMYGASATLFVVLVAHLVEWIWHTHQKRWFIFAFNVSSFAIVISAADLARQWVTAVPAAIGWEDVLSLILAAAAFTLLNHLMIGLVLWFARGEPIHQSGVMGRLTLMIDFSTFGLGMAAALTWLVHPLAVVLILAPLYLIYSTLRVPALERQTQIDAKTGLFNARYFNDALEKELARADRHDRPLVVVMADLDLLRNINNTYG